jgi:hypothetical protein
MQDDFCRKPEGAWIMPDPFTASVLGLGIGDVLSMALFLVDQRGSRKTAQDILRALKDGAVIRDYIEWLRRKDHRQLIEEISAGKEMLLAEVGRLGTELQGLAAGIRHEVENNQRDLVERFAALNRQFLPPVLSRVPLRSRPLADVPMVARDKELEWLHRQEGDAVVSGQPGSGKTFLLYHYGKQTGGMFLLTDNADDAVKVVLGGCPAVIFIDDAADKESIIRRLIHARQEHGLSFRLVLVCWPFERDAVAAAARVGRSNVLELELLGRQVIAELVQSVIKTAGYTAPNDVVREIVNQSAGRPGLAVDLTVACLQDDIQRVMRGDTLAEQIGLFYRRVAGPQATPVLASFALGGKAGMDMQAVATAMGVSILDIYAMTKRMAPGGVLEEVSTGRLAARPAALRRALLKEVFFNPTQASLPIWSALFDNAPDQKDSLLAILGAAHIDAHVDSRWLREKVGSSGDEQVWDAYAALGKEQCDWVFERHPQRLSLIVDAALRHLPARMIRHLLSQTVDARRPLNAYPDAPRRKLADWVAGARAGTPAAVNRRRILFEVTRDWLAAGGDYGVALSAFGACFQLGYEFSDTDPGDGMKITFSSGLLTVGEAAEVAKFWPPLLELLKARGIPDWKPVLGIVRSWLSPSNRFGKDPGEEYEKHTRPTAKRIIEDLLAAFGTHNGFTRWVYMHASKAGISLESVPANPEYMTLYPPERFGDDWKEEEKRQAAAAEQLAAGWLALPHGEVVARLVRYEAEASAMESSWPRWTPYVCRTIAAGRDVTSADVTAVLDTGLAADLVEPYILRALEAARLDESVLKRCLEDARYRWLLIHHVLTKPIPRLLDDVSPLLGEYAQPIEHLGLRRPLPEGVMRHLLVHADPNVRLAAALCEYASDRERHVRETLRVEWRAALLSGVVAKERTRDLRNVHELRAIVEYDRTLAFDILAALITKDAGSMAMWDIEPLAPLVAVLTVEARQELIDRCGGLMMTDLVAMLVGNDRGLFAHLLANPALKDHHLKPLSGDPSQPGWTDKAMLAMDAGYTPERISHAALGRSWGSWGRVSAMWQGWIDKFEKLLAHADPRVREVGKTGMEWAAEHRDKELRQERHEDIHGRFDE